MTRGREAGMRGWGEQVPSTHSPILFPRLNFSQCMNPFLRWPDSSVPSSWSCTSPILPGEWQFGRDAGLIPGSRRSPGGGHGNPLQCSCLENPTDKEPGRPQSMGSLRVRHDWGTRPTRSEFTTKPMFFAGLAFPQKIRRELVCLPLSPCSLQAWLFHRRLEGN